MFKGKILNLDMKQIFIRDTHNNDGVKPRKKLFIRALIMISQSWVLASCLKQARKALAILWGSHWRSTLILLPSTSFPHCVPKARLPWNVNTMIDGTETALKSPSSLALHTFVRSLHSGHNNESHRPLPWVLSISIILHLARRCWHCLSA